MKIEVPMMSLRTATQEWRRTPVRRHGRGAFSLVELLVAMTLLSLIVLALMAVFSGTERAFRAGVTQTDVLEGARATVDLMATDLRTMTPSDGYTNGTVNFMTLPNDYKQDGSSAYFTPSLFYQPLIQPLPGTATTRMNVLNYFFLLGRNNQKWTAVGYVVATNAPSLYPLYRFYMETNIAASPAGLFTAFYNTIYSQQWTNMSHVMDGVVHMTVRPFDTAGYWMTNTHHYVVYYGAGNAANITNIHDNVWFATSWNGEVGCYFFSNAVPAAVEVQLGVLEDRTLKRAESLTQSTFAESNYLSQQSGHVHLFRQRVTIPNVDPTAYQ